MREEIMELFAEYKVEPTEYLIDALVWFVNKSMRDARYEAVMETMDKVRASFGVRKSEDNA